MLMCGAHLREMPFYRGWSRNNQPLVAAMFSRLPAG
jgi:hypothetical protein